MFCPTRGLNVGPSYVEISNGQPLKLTTFRNSHHKPQWFRLKPCVFSKRCRLNRPLDEPTIQRMKPPSNRNFSNH